MALYSQNTPRVPEDAIQLSKEEAITYQENIIKTWKNKSDTWWLRYGEGILVGASGLTGAFLQNHYRYKLRLQSFARFSSYLPVVIIPSVVSGLLHHKVKENILVQRYTCPLCLELRAVAYQAITGVFYPAVLAPVAAFMMATRYHTYNVPLMTTDPKGVLGLYKRFTRPVTITLMCILAAHSLLATLVTYKENENVLRIQAKMIEAEKQMDAEMDM